MDVTRESLEQHKAMLMNLNGKFRVSFPSTDATEGDYVTDIQNALFQMFGYIGSKLRDIPRGSHYMNEHGQQYEFNANGEQEFVNLNEELTSAELGLDQRIFIELIREHIEKICKIDYDISLEEIAELEAENRKAGEELKEVTKLGEKLFDSIQSSISKATGEFFTADISDSEDEY